MTYSYDPTKIRERGKDQMRFELGDTVTEGGADTCALSDEEYDAILDGLKEGKKAWVRAKLAVLEAIMFRFSYQMDTKVDVLQYGLGDRAAHWKQLYDDLKKQVRASVSVPAMASAIQNTPPYFHTGMEENPRAVHGASSPPFRKMTT